MHNRHWYRLTRFTDKNAIWISSNGNIPCSERKSHGYKIDDAFLIAVAVAVAVRKQLHFILCHCELVPFIILNRMVQVCYYFFFFIFALCIRPMSSFSYLSHQFSPPELCVRTKNSATFIFCCWLCFQHHSYMEFTFSIISGCFQHAYSIWCVNYLRIPCINVNETNKKMGLRVSVCMLFWTNCGGVDGNKVFFFGII